MDSDQGKLFIGGISWETTEDKLREYFGKYGEVTQVVIMRDKISGRPRGFGFVVFSDHTLVDLVLQDKHTIDGRVVEAKRAMSREEQNTSSRSGIPSSRQSFGGSGGSGQRTKKIFVGGLPPTLSEEAFRKYFETFGSVTDVVVMYDQTTQRPRGFGFISFDSEDAVDRVLYKTFHDLGGKLVEVKRAMPKDALGHGSGNGRPMGGSGGGGGGYQGGYGSPNPGSGGYEGRMDGGRYMGPQSGGGFPHYGSSGYGYAYGSGSNGVSYGGYGMGGYGGPGGGYGNPNAPAGGYPGGPRSPWSGQPPSGYGSTGYGGSAGYGAGSGHSPSGSGSYGNPGYGYGGYGSGSEFISRGGGSAGSGGGDQHGPGSGYMGGGYGDVGGGHPSSWKSDPSQGGGYGPGQSGYGSYGGGPSRLSQQ